MKIKVLVVMFFVVLLQISCNKEKELRDILKANCYWDILNKGAIHPVNSCFKFKDDGSCNFYYYYFFDKKRTDSVYKYDDGDVIVPNRWHLKNDSFQIRANQYYLIRYTSDSVFLTATGIDTMVLIRNCMTVNPNKK